MMLFSIDQRLAPLSAIGFTSKEELLVNICIELHGLGAFASARTALDSQPLLKEKLIEQQNERIASLEQQLLCLRELVAKLPFAQATAVTPVANPVSLVVPPVHAVTVDEGLTERDCNVMVYGLKEDKDTVLTQFVQEKIVDALDIKGSGGEKVLVSAERIGKEGGDKPRPVVVKFVSKEVRNTVLRKKKRVHAKKGEQDFFRLDWDLTPKQRQQRKNRREQYDKWYSALEDAEKDQVSYHWVGAELFVHWKGSSVLLQEVAGEFTVLDNPTYSSKNQ